MTSSFDRSDVRDALESKIRMLSKFVWEQRVNNRILEDWVLQFDEDSDIEKDEQLHALFLLSHFLYFGQDELRFLLKSLYRDLIVAPMLQAIRRQNANTLDLSLIQNEFRRKISNVRFLGVGNPAESGVHLLYYFRQENRLPKNLFINTHEIFNRHISGSNVGVTLRDPDIDRYIFIDDLCGSGDQAEDYSRHILDPLRTLSSTATASYFVLFGTSHGLESIRALNRFEAVEAVFELDDTFKSLEAQSRIFQGEEGPFKREDIRSTCKKYGQRLFPTWPLGYRDGQLLLGFNHNTPDNTLPIFWGGVQSQTGPWKPVFRRYGKV